MAPVNNIPEINAEEVRILQLVGEGSYGKVHKGLWKDLLVAIKDINDRWDESKEQNGKERSCLIEIRQLSRVKHKNIVGFYGYFKRDQLQYSVVMEYADCGSLYDVLHRQVQANYSLAHAISWVYQCAQGVEYLHALTPKPIIHRDLKPLNLLLFEGCTKLKICDFGTAIEQKTTMTNNTGSAAWMAPEVFKSDKYSLKCDVYSWAIIFWEVLSRQKPYSKGTSSFEILWKVNKGHRPQLFNNCPPAIEKLMTQCWSEKESDRPTMAQVVQKTKIFSSLLSGADEPIDMSVIDEYEEEVEEEEPSDVDEFIPIFPDDNTENSRVIPMPQPDKNMGPLQIEIGPESTWENYDLCTMPGFDRAIPRNGTTNTVQAGIQSTADEASNTNPDVYLLLENLDPHLRPVTPDKTDPRSLQLYEEHKELAKDYFTVQEEMVYITQRKNKLLQAQNADRQRKRELRELQNELETLAVAWKLQTESENGTNSAAGGSGNGENWVLVPRGGLN